MQTGDITKISISIASQRNKIISQCLSTYFNQLDIVWNGTVEDVLEGRFDFDVVVQLEDEVNKVVETYYIDGMPLVSFGSINNEVTETESGQIILTVTHDYKIHV